MILKYQTPAEEPYDKEIFSEEGQRTTHVISGIDRYEFRYSVVAEEGHELDLCISYHLAKDADVNARQFIIVCLNCKAFIMNDEGKTIERIR